MYTVKPLQSLHDTRCRVEKILKRCVVPKRTLTSDISATWMKAIYITLARYAGNNSRVAVDIDKDEDSIILTFTDELHEQPGECIELQYNAMPTGVTSNRAIFWIVKHYSEQLNIPVFQYPLSNLIPMDKLYILPKEPMANWDMTELNVKWNTYARRVCTCYSAQYDNEIVSFFNTNHLCNTDYDSMLEFLLTPIKLKGENNDLV